MGQYGKKSDGGIKVVCGGEIIAYRKKNSNRALEGKNAATPAINSNVVIFEPPKQLTRTIIRKK